MATHITGPLYVSGVPVSGLPVFGGNYYFCDYVNGSDGWDGTLDFPLKTITAAYAKCRDGRGDCVVILSGDDGTTYTQRLSTPLTWAKDNTHLVGLGAAPGAWGRARVSEATGVSCSTTPMVTLSGHNCVFSNVNFYQSTNVAGAIAFHVSGNRNQLVRCHFAGITGTTAAGSVNSRSLKVTGSENLFEECAIGIDTVARAAACTELELASAATRNRFWDCDFMSYHSASGGDGCLFVKIGASGIDRFVEFTRCRFINAGAAAAGRAMTAAMSIHASAGGVMLCDQCIVVGATDVHSGSPTNLFWSQSDATSSIAGLAVNPTET